MRLLQALALFCTYLPNLLADSESETSLKIHRAMSQAQASLINNKPSEAIRVLEAVSNIAQSTHGFSDLLQEAYQSQIDHLKRTNADALSIQQLERKLQAIKSPAILKVSEITPPPPPALPSEPTPMKSPVTSDISRNLLVDAGRAFNQKDYETAERLYRQAHSNGTSLSRTENEAWAYCKLNAIMLKLNEGAGGASLDSLAVELDQAIELGGDRIAKLSENLKAEIQKRKSANFTGKPEDQLVWNTLEGENFRIRYSGSKSQAQEVLLVAEECRKFMYDRWSGAPLKSWSSPCEIQLYPSAKLYSQATGRPVSSSGHCQAIIKGGNVEARSISLHIEELSYLDTTLPREVTHLILAELFSDTPLPRWADIGIAALSEPTSEIARSLRAVSQMATKGNQLYTVDYLMKSKEIPTGEPLTIYYAESVSLVHYLVKLKGAKTFMAFLREAPRRGFDSALKNQYGFRDTKDLQDKWLKSITSGE